MAETVEQREPTARRHQAVDTKVRDWTIVGFVMGTIFGFLLGQFMGAEEEACPDLLTDTPLVVVPAQTLETDITLTPTTASASGPPATAAMNTEGSAVKVTKPVYDFYTVLSDPTAETSKPTPASKPITTKPVATKPTIKPKPVIKPTPAVKPVLIDSTTEHLLQVGSFTTQVDAEKHVAKLALLDVPSRIRSVKVKDTVVHRVLVGPITGRLARDAMKQKLKSNKINSFETRFNNAATSPAPSPSLPVTPISTASGYLLQTASFHQTSEAQSYKAQLALRGVVTFIKSKVINGKTVYRVVVGPFGSQSEAEARKRNLANQNINSILIKAG